MNCTFDLQQVWTWSYWGERLMPQSTVPDTHGGVKRYWNTEKTKKGLSHKNYCKDGICSFSPWGWISNAQVLCGWFLEVNASLSYLSALIILCEIFSVPIKVSLVWVPQLGFFQVESLPSLVFCKFSGKLLYEPYTVVKNDFDFSVDLCYLHSPSFIQW